MQKRLGLRKMDEMERQIAARAQGCAYLFLVGALLVWTLYESWRVYCYQERLNLTPGLLLVGAVLVQGFTGLWLSRRAVLGDEDSNETGPLLRLVLLASAVAGVVAAAVAAVVLLGVVRA